MKEPVSALSAASPTKQKVGEPVPARVIQHETLLLRARGAQNSMPEHCLPSSLFLFEGILIKNQEENLCLSLQGHLFISEEPSPGHFR